MFAAMDRIDVVAAVIVRSGRALLTQRHPRLEFPCKWCTPGGKAKPGESLESALFREVQEEIGIGLESRHDRAGARIYGARMIASHAYDPPLVLRACALTTYDVSAAVHPDARVIVAPDEVIGYGWFDVSALDALRDRDLLTPGTFDVIGALMTSCIRSTSR